MEEKLKLAVIYGSSREMRFCDTVVKWVESVVADYGLFAVSSIDPLTATRDAARGGHESEAAFIQATLADADAIVIVTPEYNHSFPAPLKSIIDSAKSQWHVKPVAFVSYGGLSGGIRAVEQLRQVFVEMHSVCIRASLSLPNAWELFDEQGQIRDAGVRNSALLAMLKQLHWWATQLRYARLSATTQYSEVA